MRRSRAWVVCVASLVALAGCGSSAPSGSAGSGNGEASKPPSQIMADAAAALHATRGYVMQGRMTQNGQSAVVRVVAAGSNSVEVSMSSSGETAQMLVLPSGAYLRANGSFWTAHVGSRGSLLANRWVQVPPSASQVFSAQLGRFAPVTLSRCITEDHGRLSISGRATVDGKPAVVVRDAGEIPGDAPGTLAVATAGPPYPLQVRTTGPARPGGRVDVCNDGKGGGGRGTLTFSQFNHVPPLTPPPHAIRFGQTAAT